MKRSSHARIDLGFTSDSAVRKEFDKDRHPVVHYVTCAPLSLHNGLCGRRGYLLAVLKCFCRGSWAAMVSHCFFVMKNPPPIMSSVTSSLLSP